MKIDKFNNIINPQNNEKKEYKSPNKPVKLIICDEYVKNEERVIKIKLKKDEIIEFIKKSFLKNRDESVDLTIEINKEKKKEETDIKNAQINTSNSKNQTDEKSLLTAEEATKILKNGPNDNAKIIKALEYVTEHGTDKKELPFFYLDNDMDDIAISAVRFFEKHGTKKDAVLVMSPITGKEYIPLNDRGNLYKETLKTVQKLADLTSYSEQDRIDIFYEPIENLLNHSDKEVRELAQETLEKITPKK